MWFSGYFFGILSLTVEMYLRWKLQISPFFVSGKTWKIGSVSKTYLPHCIYTHSPATLLGTLVQFKATVTQITTCYNQGMQNTISECTTRGTLKQMGSSSRRPHRVPLLSAKNRKRRLKFAQAHQNWTIEDWKNVAWSDESRFLLRHSDGRVRIWRKVHESIDPSCLVSTVQAAGGGVMVWGIFSWHTLGPLVPIEHHLNTTAYLSIVADHVHPFMSTVYPSSDGYFKYIKHFSYRKLQTCLSPSIHSENTRTSCLHPGLIVSFTEHQIGC